MVDNERMPNNETEGERYLRMLGLGEFADDDMQTADGTTKKVRDFLDVCGGHARPVLLGLETMDKNDPRYEETKQVLRNFIGNYIFGIPT